MTEVQVARHRDWDRHRDRYRDLYTDTSIDIIKIKSTDRDIDVDTDIDVLDTGEDIDIDIGCYICIYKQRYGQVYERARIEDLGNNNRWHMYKCRQVYVYVRTRAYNLDLDPVILHIWCLGYWKAHAWQNPAAGNRGVREGRARTHVVRGFGGLGLTTSHGPQLCACWDLVLKTSRGWNLLGGSWVVISGAISKVAILITRIRGLTIPLITTHEPPSTRAMKPKTAQTKYGLEVWPSPAPADVEQSRSGCTHLQQNIDIDNMRGWCYFSFAMLAVRPWSQ